MGISYIRSNEAGAVQWSFELGENIRAGAPVYVYDDTGAKVKKVFSALGDIDTEFKGYYHRSCMVDTNKVIVVYRDLLASNHVYIICGAVQPNNSVVWGAKKLVYAGYAYYLHISKINTNRFVVIYRGAGSAGWAKSGAVSGTFINLGNFGYQFSTGYSYDQTCCYVSADKFCVGFRDAGAANQGFCRIGTASVGNVITYGAAVVHGASATYENWVCCPDPATEKIAVFYRRAVGTTQAFCRCSLVSGTTLGGFSAETKVGEYPYYSCAESIATDKCAFFYRDSSDGNKAKCIIVGFSGINVVVNLADVVLIDSNMVYYTTLCKLADNEFMLAWCHYVLPYDGRLCKCKVSGTIITKETDQVFQSDRSYYNSLCRLSDTKYFLLWYSYTDAVSNYIVVEGELNLLGYATGLMQEDGRAGETKMVDILGGISEQMWGLTPGTHYYIQDDASISAISTDYPVGIALSPTSMLIIKTF